MNEKSDSIDSLTQDNSLHIVYWENKFATGIELIDAQHKKLVDLTNGLYQACHAGSKSVDAVFKEDMSRMVEYVRYHFTAEQELLKRINYPGYLDHKRQHDTLVKQILEAAKEYNEGKKFVPQNFVKTLKDWIFSHIAISDQVYAVYVHEQKKQGLLTDGQLT
jgi:hemerythrin